MLLVVTGCAGPEIFGPGVERTPTPDTNFGVPEYVQNMPKSRTGNMEQYTVFGKQYRVMDSAANFSQEGTASWYGKKFHGRKTSSGEIYDMHEMTAAHKHLPLPTYVRVTNLENSQSVIVKVNDRGPFIGDRVIDMSYAAAQLLDMVEKGTANVRVDALSTHLVAENDNASNVSVAKSFDADAVGTEATLPAPAVVEPLVAAVPLVAAPKVVEAVEVVSIEPPGAPAAASTLADNNLTVNGSEDGFVELTPEASAELADALAVEEPPAVQSFANVNSPVVLTPLDAPSGTYYIQLGAFSQSPNAKALVTKVADEIGMPAYVEKDATRKLFRVKMGPFKQEYMLENMLTALANIGIDGYTKVATIR